MVNSRFFYPHKYILIVETFRLMQFDQQGGNMRHSYSEKLQAPGNFSFLGI